MYRDIDEEQEFDEFQDACDDVSPNDVTLALPEGGISLEKSIEESQLAINYFFNNNFDEAKKLMEPWRNVSMYHAVGYSVFSFLEAILTFEHERIIVASKALKHSLHVCNKVKRKNTIGESIGKMVKKANYDQYSEIEAHAELCYAECLLLKALLTFMEDETLSTFIKAGIKIRSCYNSYKQCQQILDSNMQWSKLSMKLHFESGVKMGIGAFNLMISMLPSRVIKLLEFIGFSGNKQLGLDDLHKGYEMDGIRQILCTMTLLGYNLIVLYVLSHQEGDIEICEKILDKELRKYSNGVWFLFFKGRLEFMKCNLDTSIEWYKRSWKSQHLWPQFHHVCFWELMWVYCLKAEWKEALVFISHLLEESKWSRTIYSYQKAAIMLMLQTNSPRDKAVIDNLMKDVPRYKQRIAGKSLPMEKFAIKKAERFYNQKESLVVPILELMYIWNLFKAMRKQYDVAQNIYKIIDKEQKKLNSTPAANKYHCDNVALLYLLKGACLRQMDSPVHALECLELAISLQKSIQDDNYIVPYAIVELALLEWERGNFEKALLALEDAKKNYTGYSLESRLHFRIHTALTELKSQAKN